MEKLHFDFENCFGIGKLNTTLDFSSFNTVMIYAPNGTMKTSFARTLKIMSEENTDKKKKKNRTKDERICDRLDIDAPVKYFVTKEDGNPLKSEEIFVANPDEMEDSFDRTESVSVFLASKDLKSKYDEIVKNIDKSRKNFITAYKNISQSTDCEEELISTFATNDNPTIYDIIDILNNELKKGSYTNYNFRYNDVFDKKGIVKEFLRDNVDKLGSFIDRYQKLITESRFFHTSNDGKSTFGTYQAKILSSSLKDDAFFKVNHKIILQDKTDISSHNGLDEIIDDEINKIESDEVLNSVFKSMFSQLDANTELRAFKNCLKNNMSIIAKLSDYNNFKRKVLLGYFSDSNVHNSFNDLNKVFSSNKEALSQIVGEANKEQNKWNEIINLFNARFYVPFEAKIENQADVILRLQTPKISFIYHNKSVNKKQSREDILKILSKGEKRAFFILQMLFEIEARKNKETPSLIILDDISDSFDYQNKFAIIEYLNDLANGYKDKFRIILLTHNFDFYRNATLRIGIKNCYVAVKNNNGEIALEGGPYIMRTPLDKAMNESDVRNFIVMIPFTRNIIEYTCGTETNSDTEGENDFLFLTNCLHLKRKTESLTDKDVNDIITKYIKHPRYKYRPTGNKIIDLIFKEADKIASEEKDNVYIVDKVVLSIAIRLKSELYMRNYLLDNGETEDSLDVKKNQTTVWINKMNNKKVCDSTRILLERVNMMTPECIHINSFMYEPLMDMSKHHLVDLYNEVKKL